MELFDEERRKLDRLLRLDPLRAAPRRPDRAAPAALRPDAAALPARGRPARGRDRAGRLPPARRRPRRRARPRRGLLDAEHGDACVRLVRGAARARARSVSCGRIRCAACGAATIDPWPTDEELSRAYGDVVPAGVGPAVRRRSATSCCAARAGAWPARLDAIAPPGPVLDVGAGDGTLIDALARRGRARHRARARGRPRRTCATSRSRRSTASGRRSCSGTRSSICPRRGRRSATRRACSRPAGSWSWRCPTAGACRRGRSAIAGCTSTGRAISSISPRARSPPGSSARACSVERVSRVRGGQIVIGWLDGLVGSLPGGLNLYQALRRPEARSVPLGRGRWAASLAAAVVLLPVASVAAVVEVALRRSGTIYVEARRRSAPRGQLHDREVPGAAGDGPEPEAPVDPLQRPLLQRREHRAGRGEDVARRVRPQRGEHLAGRPVEEHPVAGAQRVDRGAELGQLLRLDEARLPRIAEEQPVRAAAADQDLDAEVGLRPSRGSRRSPGMERRSACCAGRGRRAPAAAGARGARAPRAASCRPARRARARSAGSGSSIDDHADRDDERGDGERERQAGGPRRPPDRVPAAQQQAEPEGAGEQHGQRDVDQDVVQASGRRSSSSARCRRR